MDRPITPSNPINRLMLRKLNFKSFGREREDIRRTNVPLLLLLLLNPSVTAIQLWNPSFFLCIFPSVCFRSLSIFTNRSPFNYRRSWACFAFEAWAVGVTCVSEAVSFEALNWVLDPKEREVHFTRGFPTIIWD